MEPIASIFCQMMRMCVPQEENASLTTIANVISGTLVMIAASTINCFGLNSTDANVCNGHGTCVALGTCSCESYHSGEQCEKNVFGLLFSVGSNSKGQLGDDYYDDRLIPEQTSYPLTRGKYVKHVAAGQDVSFALTTDGELYSWGQGKTVSNSLSLLGDGALVDRNRPVRIMSSFAPVTHVGSLHVVVSTSDNRVYAWGLNTVGESMTCQANALPCPCAPADCPSKSGVPGNSSYYWTNTPIEVTRPSDNFMGESIVELTCGTRHTILRTPGGRIYGWGVNPGKTVEKKPYVTVSAISIVVFAPVMVFVCRITPVSVIQILWEASVIRHDLVIYLVPEIHPGVSWVMVHQRVANSYREGKSITQSSSSSVCCIWSIFLCHSDDQSSSLFCWSESGRSVGYRKFLFLKSRFNCILQEQPDSFKYCSRLLVCCCINRKR